MDLAMIVEISVNKPKRKYIFASLKWQNLTFFVAVVEKALFKKMIYVIHKPWPSVRDQHLNAIISTAYIAWRDIPILSTEY